VRPRHELDHDATAFDALDRRIAGVHAQFFTDLLLDRDLPAFSYSA
jgi:hypothetical protein